MSEVAADNLGFVECWNENDFSPVPLAVTDIFQAVRSDQFQVERIEK